MKSSVPWLSTICSKTYLFACSLRPWNARGEASIGFTKRVRYDKHLLDRAGKIAWSSTRPEKPRIQTEAINK